MAVVGERSTISRTGRGDELYTEDGSLRPKGRHVLPMVLLSSMELCPCTRNLSRLVMPEHDCTPSRRQGQYKHMLHCIDPQKRQQQDSHPDDRDPSATSPATGLQFCIAGRVPRTTLARLPVLLAFHHLLCLCVKSAPVVQWKLHLLNLPMRLGGDRRRYPPIRDTRAK
jgi:hypothetical protein